MNKTKALNQMNAPTRPCVGCGFCCLTAPCTASVRLYPAAKKCPELRWDKDKNRYICRLMTLPDDLGAFYRSELYAGEGCCSPLNSWRTDVKQRIKDGSDPESKSQAVKLDSYFQVFLGCLGRQFMSQDLLYLTAMGFYDILIKRGVPKPEADDLFKQVLFFTKRDRPEYLHGFI